MFRTQPRLDAGRRPGLPEVPHASTAAVEHELDDADAELPPRSRPCGRAASELLSSLGPAQTAGPQAARVHASLLVGRQGARLRQPRAAGEAREHAQQGQYRRGDPHGPLSARVRFEQQGSSQAG